MQGQDNKRFTLKEKSWILYDWANSVYATNIMAAIYPPIFVSVAGQNGDHWWSLGTALTTLVIALILLIVSAILRAKSRAKSDSAYDTFQISGTRDYTTPADETKQSPREPEDVKTDGSAADKPAIELPHEKYLKPAAPGEKPADTNVPKTADEEGAFRLTREEDAGFSDAVTEKTGNGDSASGAERRGRRLEQQKPDDSAE